MTEKNLSEIELADADLTAMLDGLGAVLKADLAIVEERLPELRRQAHLAGQRRGGPHSRDARKYALGWTLMLLGLEKSDETTLLGLFAQTDLMLRWMVEVRRDHGPLTFDALIERVLADARRQTFCQQWGRILQWRYRKPIYDAAVTSFVQSGRTGPDEKWRRHDVTHDQEGLIATLCALLSEPPPGLRTKGEAFDWIYRRGGNPTFWTEPQIPEEWRNA